VADVELLAKLTDRREPLTVVPLIGFYALLQSRVCTSPRKLAYGHPPMIFMYPHAGRLTKVSLLTKLTKATSLLSVETCDLSIRNARKFLEETSRRKADELTLTELQTEVVELRRLLRQTIQVADDCADAFPVELLTGEHYFVADVIEQLKS
jgi:hypothetical protein